MDHRDCGRGNGEGKKEWLFWTLLPPSVCHGHSSDLRAWYELQNEIKLRPLSYRLKDHRAGHQSDSRTPTAITSATKFPRPQVFK